MEGVPTKDRVHAARDAAEEDLLLRRPRTPSRFLDSLLRYDIGRTGLSGVGPENVVGVGIATSERGGSSVAVYVVRKVPLEELDDSTRVPETYEGVATTVIESGEFVAASTRDRHRPVPLGVSIGHLEGETGTSGFFARRGDQLLLVGNNHVLAGENQAQRGDTIIQPGLADGGGPGDRVAELSHWVELDFGGEGRVDAAAASMERGQVRNAPLEGGGYVEGTAEVIPRRPVRKCGRTTGPTFGEVADISASIHVAYSRGSVLLRDQVLVRGNGGSFARGGDSGSLIVDDATGRPMALLCAVSPKDLAVGNKIDRVLGELEVSWAGVV